MEARTKFKRAFKCRHPKKWEQLDDPKNKYGSDNQKSEKVQPTSEVVKEKNKNSYSHNGLQILRLRNNLKSLLIR